jgi:nucleotide-binding universal stress UspA family protein
LSLPRSILVPVDFSEHSERALVWAADLASKLGARLHLLHSYLDLPARMLEHNVWIPEDVWARIRDEDGQRLAELRERCVPAEVPVDVHQSPMVASEAIEAHARDLGVDLIVMGTRGLGGIKHVLLGSTAERTLRSSPCPVVTVRADAGRAGRKGHRSGGAKG